MEGEHDQSPTATTPRPRVWVRWLKIVIRLVLLAIVTWGIWKTMVQARREMAAHEFQWGQVHVAWLVAAGLLYLVGIAPCGIFWHRALWAMGQRPRGGSPCAPFGSAIWASTCPEKPWW